MTLMVESLRLNNPFAGVFQRGKEGLDKLSRVAQESIDKAQAVGRYVVANRETIAREVVKNTKANAPAMAAGAATRIGLTAEASILGVSTVASVVALPAVAVAVGVGSAVAKYGIEDKRLKKIGAKAFFVLHAGRHMKAEEAEMPQARGVAGSILHAMKKAGDFAAHGLEERTVSGAFKVQDRRKKVAKVVSHIGEGQSATDYYQGRVSKALGFASGEVQRRVALKMLQKDSRDAFIAYVTATNSDVKAKARTAYLSLKDAADSLAGKSIQESRIARKADLRREIGKNAKNAVMGMANIQLVKAPLRVATGAFLAEKAIGALGFVKDRVGEAASAVQQGFERVREDVEQSVNVATSGTPLPPVSSNSIKMASLSTGGSLPPSSGDNSPVALVVSNVKNDQPIADVSANTPLPVKKGDISTSPVKLDKPFPPLHPPVAPPADPPPTQPQPTFIKVGDQKIPVYSPSTDSSPVDKVKVGDNEIPVYKPAAVKSVVPETQVISPPVVNNPSIQGIGSVSAGSEVTTVVPSSPAISVSNAVDNAAPEFITLPNGIRIPIYRPAGDVVSTDTINPPTSNGGLTPSTTVFRNDSVVIGQTEIPVYKPPVSDTVTQVTDNATNSWSDAVKAMQDNPVTSFSSLDLANSAAQKISITSSRPDIFSFPNRPFVDWKLNWDQTLVPGGDQAFYFASPDGGLIVQPHSGYLADRAGNNLEQFFEPVRRFLEGGNNGVPRFTEAQTLARLDQLNKLKPTITLTQGGQKLNLVLEDARILPRDAIVANGFYGADPTRLSGGADTMTFVFCTRSYADGIKVFDTVADAIPANLKAELAVLHNPNATGAQVQNAIVKLAKWLELHDKSKYMEFRKLYDYFGKTSPEIQREFPDMYSWGRAKLTFKVVKP